MRRDYLFHELYSEDHRFTKPRWILHVAHNDREPIFVPLKYPMIATTARI
jgi:hypothetical protein